MATPVPRAGCAPFWEEPILAEIRGSARESCEFVFLGEAMAARTGREHCEAENPRGRGTSASGGCESVSGRRSPPQSCGAVRTAGKGRCCHLPGVGEGADVLAATRSSSPHDYGEDR